jgi:hypothetical protein
VNSTQWQRRQSKDRRITKTFDGIRLAGLNFEFLQKKKKKKKNKLLGDESGHTSRAVFMLVRLRSA